MSSQAQRTSQRVAPFPFTGEGREALATLKLMVESMRGVHIRLATESYLHAEFSSPVFRFVDDLELLVDATEKVIHVRSASRVGTWDLGANRRRVESLRRRLEARLSATR